MSVSSPISDQPIKWSSMSKKEFFTCKKNVTHLTVFLYYPDYANPIDKTFYYLLKDQIVHLSIGYDQKCGECANAGKHLGKRQGSISDDRGRGQQEALQNLVLVLNS